MPPTREPQPTPALLTGAELVNEEIRAFMLARSGRPLFADEAAEYQRLLQEWAAATRAELVPAA